jgi:predicted Zn-dependent peptidase
MSLRIKAPAIHPLQKINFVEPKIFDITPTVKLYWMQPVPDETMRIEFHFDAGTIRGNRKIAGFVNSLLLSGTANKTSTQINQELDGLGAYLDQEIAQELAIVSLYCLKENVEKAVAILVNAIQEVAFHEHEISDMLREKKQQFLVSSEKVSVLVRRAFQKQLFSNSENYNRQLELTDLEDVSVLDLKRFHKEFYLQGLRKVIVVGDVEPAYIDQLIDTVGAWSKLGTCEFETDFINIPGRLHIEKKDAVQTAIRMGIPLFNKTHEDFLDFQILQTIFGDYFGSRLMSNIREDKGYTYGIGCGVAESNNAGYFIISTEVGKDVAEATMIEIKNEMDLLKKELVPQEELNLVKNYLLGQILKSADGPNAMIDLYMAAHLHDKDFNYYNEAIQHIQNISQARILELANKYLNWDNFTIVTAGTKVKLNAKIRVSKKETVS